MVRPSRLIALLCGLLLSSAGLGLAFGGGALLWANAVGRDGAGYFTSPTVRLASEGFAITSDRFHIDTGVATDRWAPPDLGTARVRAERSDGGAVFVGIARERDVEAYLRGVSHDELSQLRGRQPVFAHRAGERVPPAPDASDDVWVASTEGSGRQTLRWEVDDGEWVVVVMNADGARRVDVTADLAVKTGWLVGIGAGLLVAGAILLLAALGLIAFGVTGPREPRPDGAPAHLHPADVAPAAPAAPVPAYPLRISGHLDLQPSRWLWLVKWLLVVPHLVVLSLLWAAAAVATVAAGVVVLFTGRYPRSLFDFNVGVLRWTWRVTFYAFTLGTDKYPPFSLDPDPSFGADLDVQYPDRLSRPMVLVKWLLALPHLIVISVFGGGVTFWTWDTVTADGRGGDAVFGGGLVGILVLVSAVALAFTGRYPQPLFDFVLGMQRWTFRVLAYVGLMTDEYPPFRLDPGGSDPSLVPAYPPSSTPPVAPGRAET